MIVSPNDSNTNTSTFPFKLSDLKYWIIKRRDGTVVKYVVTDTQAKGISGNNTSAARERTMGYTSNVTPLHAYCKHDPIKPIFEDAERKIRLFIGDASGARAFKNNFTLVIDGGDVIPDYYVEPYLKGDKRLTSLLSRFVLESGPRILKIDWDDRKAPRLLAGFWTALVEEMTASGGGDILCCCQGGHGRSGSSIVSLLLALTDYTPKEAIIHLRALHCPRAIESKEQHLYLGLVGESLGRPNDVEEVEEITDYKKAFLALTSSFAEPWKKVLRGE